MSRDLPRGIIFLVVIRSLVPAFQKGAGGKKKDNECKSKVVEKIGNECECEKRGNALNPSNLTWAHFAPFFVVVCDAFLCFMLSGVAPFALK